MFFYIAGLSLAAALAPCPAFPLAQDSGSQSPPAQNAQKPAPSDAPQKSSDKKNHTAEDNPFPEDVSKKAADAAGTPATPDAPSASPDAAKPEAPSAPDNSPVKPEADAPAGRKKLKLESPEGMVPEYNPKLAADDDRVGKFYLQTGDYKGAYSRFKEATTVEPEDSQAVWGLAESARKLNLRQEAIQNYQTYLDAFPDGDRAKQAKKALSELNGAAGNTH